MNLREAILKTADLIECDPGIWNFGNARVPPCGSPGCALGLIGLFMGCRKGSSVGDVSPELLGVSSDTFYNRMHDIPHDGLWTRDAQVAAHCLRQYADTYHPAIVTSHVGIPADVRAIFERVAA